ncbi:MAG TPA: GNAT family N-acetyltransferase [Sphingobacteriaceae bacterium]|nr:GNAT family N-acetyltransferase [Sphingobacteriaceae bacterium]
MEIIDIRFEHWEQIKTIYTQGIATGNATFQAEPPDWEEWNSSHLANCRIVAVENGKVCGWAALSPVSSRCVYSGVAEVSIYVGKDHRGKQVGSHLLQQLISMSEEAGLWTLQAGIFPENKSSLRLHEKLGFRLIGYQEKVGKMNNIWRNVNLLERRSKTTGTD